MNTRNTTATLVPARVTFNDLVVRGGGIADAAKPVLFERGSHQFKAPGIYVDKPLESIEVYKTEVEAMFEMISHTEAFPGYGFNDVAVNFTRLLRKAEGGIARSVRTPGRLPAERTVEIGYDSNGKMQYETIPGDWMSVPGLQDATARAMTDGSGQPIVQLKYRRFCQEAVIGFLKYLHDMLRVDSIYRGHAIDSNFQYVDVSRVDPSKAVYSQEVGRLLNKWCLSPITNWKVNDEAGISPKANVILVGPPGTGKTMFLNIIKRHAVDHDWMAIELPPGANPYQFEAALATARVYMDRDKGKGVVLIAEDIEKMAEQDRARTLEVLDGSKGKHDRLLVVMTSNYPEQMDKAMVRAERIHALITVELPDLDVYTRLVQMRLGDQLADVIDWPAAFAANEGYTPAWIIGGLESVIRGVIARTGTTKDLSITTEDLIDAANDYRAQYKLQQGARDIGAEQTTSLGSVMRDLIIDTIADMDTEQFVDYGTVGAVLNQRITERINETEVNLTTESGNKVTGRLNLE